MDFLAVLGGVASAIAIATFVGVLLRAWRRRRQRSGLRQMTERLETLAEAVKTTAVEIDHRHSDGAEWAGWAIWPDSLGPHIQLLDRVITESEALTAQARGIAADATLDRLRADIENAGVVLRSAASLYRDGTISNYREHLGEPIPPGATGRDTTAALAAGTERAIDETRRAFTLLIRTCLFQLGEDVKARAYDVGWPILRGEIGNLDPEWKPAPIKEGQRPAPPIGEGY